MKKSISQLCTEIAVASRGINANYVDNELGEVSAASCRRAVAHHRANLNNAFVKIMDIDSEVGRTLADMSPWGRNALRYWRKWDNDRCLEGAAIPADDDIGAYIRSERD